MIEKFKKYSYEFFGACFGILFYFLTFFPKLLITLSYASTFLEIWAIGGVAFCIFILTACGGILVGSMFREHKRL